MRDHQPALEREEAVARPVVAPPAPHLARILALQHSAGNHAVAGMLNRFSEEQEDEYRSNRNDKKKLIAASEKFNRAFGGNGPYADWPSARSWDRYKRDAKDLGDLDTILDQDIVKAAAWLKNKTDFESRPKEKEEKKPPTPQPQGPQPHQTARPKATVVDLSGPVKSQWEMIKPATVMEADDNPLLPGEVLPPLQTVFTLGDYTQPITSWSPTKHGGKGATNLTLANVKEIVQWLRTGYARRAKVFVKRGEGSGEYAGDMQLKIIHKTEHAQGSTKKATYHLSLKRSVYDALNEVEYAGADWDG